MKLVEAIKAAGEYGYISRPSWPIYPFGIEIERDCDGELGICADLSVADLEANDYEVVVNKWRDGYLCGDGAAEFVNI